MAAQSLIRRWRKQFWRLHRRIGISSLLFLAVMAITGIALNHVDQWKLFDKPLPYRFSVWIYGELQTEQIYQFKFGDKDLYQSGDVFYLEDQRLELDCLSNSQKTPQGATSGVAFYSELLWIGCQSSIHIFQMNGDFVEKILLPIKDISALGNCSDSLCVKQFDQWFKLDDLSLAITKIDAEQTVELIEKQLLEGDVNRFRITPPELNFGRLIADTHSGVIFGQAGRIFADLLGLVILFLCGSGCYLWLGNKRP